MTKDIPVPDDFAIEFSDLILIAADGEYEKVKEDMLSDEFTGDDWMLRTDAILSTKVGVAKMVLHFYASGDVYIIEYYTRMMDLYYNPDIQNLSMWTQERGWNTPRPHSDIVRSNISFWKHFWETHVIDCDFLDQQFGERKDSYDPITEETED